MATQANFITVEQYEHSFEGYPGLRDELINGRIVMTPDAKPLHQHIQRNLQRLLDIFTSGTGYIVNGDSNIKFPNLHSSLSPDVFVISRTKWYEAMQNAEYLDTPPLIAVEILSPSQDIKEKIDVYLKGGVTELWVVDPKNIVVSVYSAGVLTSYRPGNVVPLPRPFKGFIKVNEIFDSVPDSIFDPSKYL